MKVLVIILDGVIVQRNAKKQYAIKKFVFHNYYPSFLVINQDGKIFQISKHCTFRWLSQYEQIVQVA